ncbi:MAG: S8 family serine peptidase, partial [Gammaproteobacteria bacterium]|nr:S8 family serine peptidase [Gammaproteobacteria bacterium]
MNVRISLLAVVGAIATFGALTMGTPAYAQSADQQRVVVSYKAGGKGPVMAALSSSKGKVHHELDRLNAVAVTLPAAALNGIGRNPHVEYVEADVLRYPLAQTTPYGIPMVQADQVGYTSAGNQKVCIIDSGYELAHEDLPGNIVDGTDDSGTGNWYTDENGHGTHVAGTIAALNNDTGVIGVAPNGNLQLHIIKVFGANGWAYSSTLANALGKCEDAGATVVSMSLGGSRASRTERRAFDNAFGRGVLSVAAAGNDGNTRHSYPASYDSVISVAAIDSTKTVADFSQQTDQVELAAPGVAVLSSVPTGTGSNVSVVVASTGYEAIGMDGSATGTGTGTLVDCGLGTSTCSGSAGAVCLIQRGDIAFSDKVLACQEGGGVAAIIYNNVP